MTNSLSVDPARRLAEITLKAPTVAPPASAVTMTTAVTPMRMPSTVSAARSLFLTIAESARRMAPRKSLTRGSSFHAHARRRSREVVGRQFH